MAEAGRSVAGARVPAQGGFQPPWLSSVTIRTKWLLCPTAPHKLRSALCSDTWLVLLAVTGILWNCGMTAMTLRFATTAVKSQHAPKPAAAAEDAV